MTLSDKHTSDSVPDRNPSIRGETLASQARHAVKALDLSELKGITRYLKELDFSSEQTDPLEEPEEVEDVDEEPLSNEVEVWRTARLASEEFDLLLENILFFFASLVERRHIKAVVWAFAKAGADKAMCTLQTYMDRHRKDPCFARALFFLHHLSDHVDRLPSLYLHGEPCLRPLNTHVEKGGEAIITAWYLQSLSKPVAVRTLLISDNHVTLKSIRREIIIQHQFNHRNVLPLLGVREFHDPNAPYGLIIPLMDMNASAYVKKNPRAFLHVVQQASAGLKYLHNLRPLVVHGDLHGSNILIQVDSETLEIRVQLADFGFTRLRHFIPRPGSAPKSLGRFRYVAPEFYLEEVTDPRPRPETDIYSFSMVLVQLGTGEKPYPDIQTDQQVLGAIIKRNHRPSVQSMKTLGELCSDSVSKLLVLMKAMWDQEPSERPTARHVRKHLKSLQNGPM